MRLRLMAGEYLTRAEAIEAKERSGAASAQGFLFSRTVT
jgi:hypothetical protein